MFKVEIGPAALADIEQICLWMQGQPTIASSADAWFIGISEAILSLETMPKRYPLAPEAKTMEREIHQRLYGKGASCYRLLFVVYGDQAVRVLRIRHAARSTFESDELVILPSLENE
jgi:plasmid stabilization system protein ParE